MIKHQQVHILEREKTTQNTKSLMFVLENKINKQHVYRWKNGSSWLFVLGKKCIFEKFNPLFQHHN